MILKKGEEELVSRLLQENEEFRKLYDEHQNLERQIDELQKHLHLSPEEELQVNTLKKLKLQGKDRMAELLRSSHNQ